MLHFSLYIIKRFKDIRNCLLLHSLQITCADHTSGDELSVRQGGPMWVSHDAQGKEGSSIEYEFGDLPSLYPSAVGAV